MAKVVAGRQRSIGISRVLQFFREGNPDEVRAVMPLVIEAVGARHLTINGPSAVAPEPREVKRRHRRTKAELAEAKTRLNGEAAAPLANWPDNATKGATA